MFVEDSVSVNETGGSVNICVQVVNITAFAETPFQVNITLTDGTAGEFQATKKYISG